MVMIPTLILVFQNLRWSSQGKAFSNYLSFSFSTELMKQVNVKICQQSKRLWLRYISNAKRRCRLTVNASCELAVKSRYFVLNVISSFQQYDGPFVSSLTIKDFSLLTEQKDLPNSKELKSTEKKEKENARTHTNNLDMKCDWEWPSSHGKSEWSSIKIQCTLNIQLRPSFL